MGLVDPVAIANECAKAAARGITTSTYGLGHSFNERLMTEMARADRTRWSPYEVGPA